MMTSMAVTEDIIPESFQSLLTNVFDFLVRHFMLLSSLLRQLFTTDPILYCDVIVHIDVLCAGSRKNLNFLK
jgi:hypothetical protein